MGEDVSYSITDQANKDLFISGLTYRVFDSGKGVAGYRKFTDKNMCKGTYFICLHNDNDFQGIDATVKVVAIIETKSYEDKTYDRMKINPRYVTLQKRKAVVKSTKVRTNE